MKKENHTFLLILLNNFARVYKFTVVCSIIIMIRRELNRTFEFFTFARNWMHFILGTITELCESQNWIKIIKRHSYIRSYTHIHFPHWSNRNRMANQMENGSHIWWTHSAHLTHFWRKWWRCDDDDDEAAWILHLDTFPANWAKNSIKIVGFSSRSFNYLFQNISDAEMWIHKVILCHWENSSLVHWIHTTFSIRIVGAAVGCLKG